MGNPALTVKINTAMIKKYLTDENYKSDPQSKGKFKIDNWAAIYDGIPLSQIGDYEEKTISYSNDDKIKGFAKQMQNIIKREALLLGYTEEN